MKIAIPTRNEKIDGHFGHCEYYTIFELDNNKNVVSQQRYDSPAGCGCKSNIIPQLANLGVTVMLAGNMGDGAIINLNSAGISVVRGCSGDVTGVLQSWLTGNVKDSGIGCREPHSCNH
ncbi:MAG: NifB/NifX family molybdenum-iron cluster-binding protein [Candidatus Marinimicrobia bacterium]|nr:NifB/NifX family molybdenum-iron cluster-binding protein [Candidatus Neomarinimicrobiota bacterium]MBL7022482.1 NifB/NifX family molybdenum-iron cluster-binding protein [Candidatus Neomarinimicrobiota bacterium]MBL7108663.1 NifB/NifX family molybdenum-iron cluster-binding protein [Candidatus Neomarinimicrobiota bacterium]